MTLRRKLLWALLLLVVLALGGAYIYFKDRRYAFTFTEEQVREKLAERTPFRRTYLLIFGISLERPRIDFLEGSNRIRAGMDVRLNWRMAGEEKDLGGSIDATAVVRYDPETKAFYLTDPKVESLKIDGIPKRHAAKAEEALSLGLAEFYSTQPIYQLRATDAKRAAAKLLLKDVQVKDQTLTVTLGL